MYFSAYKCNFQCTNNFFSAQIYFAVHKYVFSAQIYFPVHKYIFSAQIYFAVHKYTFQCTNIFSSAPIYLSVHKYIFQCTNIFFSAQIYFPVHKYIFSTLRRELSTVPAIYFKAVSVLVRITQQHFTSQSSNAKKKKLYSLLGVNLIAH